MNQMLNSNPNAINMSNDQGYQQQGRTLNLRAVNAMNDLMAGGMQNDTMNNGMQGQQMGMASSPMMPNAFGMQNPMGIPGQMGMQNPQMAMPNSPMGMQNQQMDTFGQEANGMQQNLFGQGVESNLSNNGFVEQANVQGQMYAHNMDSGLPT